MGYDIKHAVKASDSVMAGVRWLQTQRFTVVPRCVLTTQNLKKWSYKLDRDGEVKHPPKYGDTNKDALDAVRYAVARYSVEGARHAKVVPLVSFRNRAHNSAPMTRRRRLLV